MTHRAATVASCELWDGEVLALDVAGQPILVTKIAGTVYAYRDRCAHLGVKLSDGRLDGCVLTCRAHHWQYDVTTGQGVNPRTAALTPVPVQVRDGVIVVDADEICDSDED